VLVNASTPSAALLRRYEEDGARLVAVDDEAISEHGVQVWVEDLLGGGDFIRHDSDKLARAVLALAPPWRDPADDPVVVATRAALRQIPREGMNR
jgi:hypothetical protein